MQSSMAFGRENAGTTLTVKSIVPLAGLDFSSISQDKRIQALSQTPVLGKLWLLLDMLCALGQNPHAFGSGQKKKTGSTDKKNASKGADPADGESSSDEYQKMLFELFQATDLLIEGLGG